MGRNAQKRRRQRAVLGAPAASWIADDGVHAIVRGEQPSPAQLDAMTKAYQERIRKSSLWDQMVREFGEVRAKELLAEFRAKLAWEVRDNGTQR